MNEFFEKIFDISLDGGKPSLPLIVWAVYAGVMIAIALSLVSRVYSYKLVYALMAAKAETSDTAKSFAGLSLRKCLIYKLIFRPGTPLSKYIKTSENGMYLPEEKRIGASIRFSREKHPVMTFVFALVAFFAVGCFVIIFLPQILDAYNSVR